MFKLKTFLILVILQNNLLFLTGCEKNTQVETQIPSKNPSSPPPVEKPKPQEINRVTDIRALPGKLDNIPIINSNSPEWLKKEGILLSTFPSSGKAFPNAHLGYPLTGKFELFDHHYIVNPPESQTIYIGFLVQNPNEKPISLNISEAASNLIVATPNSKKQNPLHGSRASDAILRGVRQANFPAQLIIPPNEYRLIINQPIETKGLARALNGLSSHIRFNSLEKDTKNPALIHFASLAMYGKKDANGKEREPNIDEWRQLLEKGDLAKPRDKKPTPPQTTRGNLIYSRVAGVQIGAKWQTKLTDFGKSSLQIPESDKYISFVISSLRAGTFGTNQIQAANLLVRYPDTAYEAHGNYGVHYDLTAPLFNPTDKPQTVTVTLETPIKSNKNKVLTFKPESKSSAVFSGLVRLRYQDDAKQEVLSYITIKQSRGQIVKPLLTLQLQPQETRNVRVDFLYPPDSTPPQVITFHTLD